MLMFTFWCVGPRYARDVGLPESLLGGVLRDPNSLHLREFLSFREYIHTCYGGDVRPSARAREQVEKEMVRLREWRKSGFTRWLPYGPSYPGRYII